jgi:hypothetical protein
MCKPVADKAETAVAYFAARSLFVGFGISLVAFHGVPLQATWLTQTLPVVGADNLLLAHLPKQATVQLPHAAHAVKLV